MADSDADMRAAVDMVLDLFGPAVCLQAEALVQFVVRPRAPWSWCAAKCVIVCHARVVRVGELGFGCGCFHRFVCIVLFASCAFTRAAEFVFSVS